jgi:hypothetical protein
MRKHCFNTDWSYNKQGESKEMIHLPHDAQIRDIRTADSPGGSAHGYFIGGVYVYEKTFDIPSNWNDKEILFEFEGIYKNSTIFINDIKAGGHPYGYTGFTVNASSLIKYGEANRIKVVADNSQLPNSRWYTGGGIYRQVWMWVGERSHIEYEGVRITTLSIDPAKIQVQTKITGGTVKVEVLDNDTVVANGAGSDIELEIPDPKLWSAEAPNLYQCKVILTENGNIVDEVIETFGIRIITYNPEGLYINGKNTLLRGGCVHHDNGILGAATYAKSEERRVRIMKEAGFNALRASHNPASKAMLDACDKHGMYMIDETFDMWYLHKTKYDYATEFNDWWRNDTQAMVERDYNHPSVIMYSICNEVSEPGEEKGIAVAKEMVDLIHSLDSTRPVTGGVNLMIISRYAKGKGIYRHAEDDKKSMNKISKTKKEEKISNGSLMFNTVVSFIGTSMNKMGNSKRVDKLTSPVLDALDIAGYNYASGRYPMEGKKHPERIIYGSETFPQDIAKNWEMVKKYPYLIGDFMWTSWDYIGEAGIGAWSYTGGLPFNRPYPWLLAGPGVINILGIPDASCRYAAHVWGLSKKPTIGVRPVNRQGVRISKSVWRGTNAIESWSWNGCEGNKAIIEVYANAELVELFLNNRSLGKKKVKAYKAIYKTPYIPGILEAVAYDLAGKELGRHELVSADNDLQVTVKPEESTVIPGDIVYIPISITDKNGTVESNADTKLTVSITDGELLAFGSANPCTVEQFHIGSYTTYYGQSLAVVRAAESGDIKIEVDGVYGKVSSSIKIM